MTFSDERLAGDDLDRDGRLAAVYAFLTKRAAQNTTALETLTTNVNALAIATDKRLAKIESEMQHMPDARRWSI